MNTSLSNFLTQPHNLAEQLLATSKTNVFCPLDQLGTLRVSGEDACTFLQNLLSNDIRTVTANQAQLSSFNSAKGRMLFSMLIWQQGSDYLLQLPLVLCEALRKKLSMYVLRSKVKITTTDILSIGLSGEYINQFTKSELAKLGCEDTEYGTLIKHSNTRCQINGNAEQINQLWEKLSSQAQAVSHTCWDWLTIRSGIPTILPATQEQFVAQMVNFELIGGVNFKKGCYPGQEIVARMQYLGKLKRRMYLAHINSDEAPQAGDELFSADMEGQASGMLVNSTPAPNGGYDVLAVIQNTSQATHSIHWKSLQGATLTFMDLPYTMNVA